MTNEWTPGEAELARELARVIQSWDALVLATVVYETLDEDHTSNQDALAVADHALRSATQKHCRAVDWAREYLRAKQIEANVPESWRI